MSADQIPYTRHAVDEEDVAAVVRVLRGPTLTGGAAVRRFEQDLADYVHARFAVAVSSGTAALHTAYAALGIGPGDEVVVPPLTFAATANAVLFLGATPVFADVDPRTGCLDPQAVSQVLGPRTKAVVAVDYAGHPCRWQALRALCDRSGAHLVVDAAHALGAERDGVQAPQVADAAVYSFHPAKHITCGEGGAVICNDEAIAAFAARFRNHGIDADAATRERTGAWWYDMPVLGNNYRITDLQCALGSSQLHKAPRWLERRRELVQRYRAALEGDPRLSPLASDTGVSHAHHLFVIALSPPATRAQRDAFVAALRGEGIGAAVHYAPVYTLDYYRRRLPGPWETRCPVAQDLCDRIVTLPLFPHLTDAQCDRVVDAVLRLAPKVPS